jgi:hypothetical protein
MLHGRTYMKEALADVSILLLYDGIEDRAHDDTARRN